MTTDTTAFPGNTALPKRAGSKHVLLAEDDLMLQQLVVCVLEECRGWRVSTVDSAPAVLVAARADRPDLILLDYRLHDGTAHEVLGAFRADEALRDVPRIVLTGDRDPDVAASFCREGALGVIHKPFDVATLAERIEALLAACETAR